LRPPGRIWPTVREAGPKPGKHLLDRGLQSAMKYDQNDVMYNKTPIIIIIIIIIIAFQVYKCLQPVSAFFCIDASKNRCLSSGLLGGWEQ
jgi:hypothetical protein